MGRRVRQVKPTKEKSTGAVTPMLSNTDPHQCEPTGTNHNYTPNISPTYAAPRVAAAQKYLTTLFAHCPTDERIGMSWKQARTPDARLQSAQFPNTFDGRKKLATRAISLNDQGHDVWVCIATLAQVVDKGRRGTTDDVRTVGTYAADIDIYDPTTSAAHAAGSTNPTESEALTIIESFGVEPTMIVSSGYGLHCYWILREAIPVAEAEHALLQQTWRAMNAMTGKSPDLGTGASNQLLRVPGTYNLKLADEPQKCRVLDDSGALVTPAQIELASTTLLSEYAAHRAAEKAARASESAPVSVGAAAPTTAGRPPKRKSGQSVIDAFNESFTIDQLLYEAGCTQAGKGRWTLPGGTSRAISTEKGLAVAFSLGGNFSTMQKHVGHDAFALLMHTKAGGDFDAALWLAHDRLNELTVGAA